MEEVRGRVGTKAAFGARIGNVGMDAVIVGIQEFTIA